MREDLQTANRSLPTTHGAGGVDTGPRAAMSLPQPFGPRGVVARLVRGKRSGPGAAADDAPDGRSPRPGDTHDADDDDGAARPSPGLQGVHKRRISPRPAELAPPATPMTPEPMPTQPPPVAAQGGLGPPWRKRGLGFVLCVVMPLLAIALYMTVIARPQYTSTAAFTVRSMDSGGMDDALTGFAQFAGAAHSTDALILAAFLESQTLLERLNGRLDLVRHYAAPFDHDPIFALSPAALIETRLSHWQRMLTVQADPASGLIDLEVNAFSPEMAQLITRELLVESRALLNDLNADAQREATAQAQARFDAARRDLAAARAALTAFRTEYRIFDPNSDFEGRVGVLRHLQGQLAQALVEQELRNPGSDAEMPRVQALRSRIAGERDRLVQVSDGDRPAYPELLATHEQLSADRDYAEAAFRTARTALDLALAQAAQRDRYLAVFVQPTLPERPDHARTLWTIGLAAFFLCLFWTIGALVHAAVRDRR